MKVTINGAIYYNNLFRELGIGSPYVFYPYQDGFGDNVMVKLHSFEVDVPDDFDPRAGKVTLLEKELDRVTVEFSATVNRINQQINSLLALENKPTEI